MRRHRRMWPLWVLGASLLAGALSAAGLSLAVFPLAEEDSNEVERYEYAQAWIGLALALLVVGLASWRAGTSVGGRIGAFVAITLLGFIAFVVIYSTVLGVACDDYSQCLIR